MGGKRGVIQIHTPEFRSAFVNLLFFMMGTVLLALAPFLVQAQLLDPVSYKIVESPDTVKSAEIFNVVVEAEIDGEWHLYSALNDPDAGPYPTTFSSASGSMKIAGEIEESEARIVLDPNFNAKLGWHSNRAVFTIPVAFRENVQGKGTINLEVLYQVCDDKSCLPPKTKSINTPVVLAGISDNPVTFSGNGQNDTDDLINLPYPVQLLIIIGVIAAVLFFRFIFHRIKEN